MNDDAPSSFVERRKYRRYKLELICSDQAMRDDLEFLRIDEDGARISIMPTGERDVTRSVKFIVQNKAFHEIDYDTEVVSKKAFLNVNSLIDFMQGLQRTAVAPAAAAMSAPVVGKHSIENKSTEGMDYRILPKANFLGKGSDSTKGRFSISDKYKIKPTEN